MKKIYLCLSLFLITTILHAEIPLLIPEKIFQTVEQCYEKVGKANLNVDNSLAKCVLSKLKPRNNPERYRANLTLKAHNSFTLLIYNDAGFIFNCKGIAGDKLQIHSCSQKKRNPLTRGQQLSVTPPK